MKRREFIRATVASGGGLFFPHLIPAGSAAPHPTDLAGPMSRGSQKNVLLLVSDDHGIEQLGCYGNRVIRTPNLDALARKGVRFTNAFAVAPTCSASRASLLTGLYPHQNGQYGHEHNWHHFGLLDWVDTMPSLLKKQGYRTGLVGKLHVGSASKLTFDYRAEGKQTGNNRDVKKMAECAESFFVGDPDAPFFLLVGYADPHREEKGMTAMKNVEDFSGFANDREYVGVPSVRYARDEVLIPGYLPDLPEVRQELADQYEAVNRLDVGIGMVLEALKRSGRADQTLVVYLSDNGIPFPGAKTNLYDSGTHVPLILSLPGSEGSVNRSMVSLIDVLPTILEWTGVRPPSYSLPGSSFLKSIGQDDHVGSNEVFGTYTFHEVTMFYPMRSIRTRRYRYIHNLFPQLEFPFATDLFVSRTWQAILKEKVQKMGKRSTDALLFRPKEELYDLEFDPDEATNVAPDSKYADVLQELRERLLAMRTRTDDHWLINDNYAVNAETFRSK